MPQTDLVIEGEAAVVTAGGSGIGERIATRLASAGVDVVINDVDEGALAGAADDLDGRPGRVEAVVGDASETAVAEELVDTAREAFGSLDIVVNNVGIAGPTEPCEEISKPEFMRTLEVNVGSAFAVSKAAIPHLKAQEYGRIVNLSSVTGKRPLRDRTPYATSKMGIIGFTRTLATELGEHGITVNAICPGSVEGPRLDDVIANQARSQGRPVEDVEREFRDASPQNEFVNADDVAETVLFLCSRSADRMTGQDLNVSAGKVMY